jgi:hypothetical protein
LARRCTRLADGAREEGVGRFTALMLANNQPMAHPLGGSAQRAQQHRAPEMLEPRP